MPSAVKALALAVASVVLGVLTGCGGQRAETPPSVTIGPNVQVSAKNADLAHGEVLIGSDPVNARHLIACSGMWTYPVRTFPDAGIRNVAYVTFDGGKSWTPAYQSHVGAFDLDPTCDIGFGNLTLLGGASAFHPGPGHDWVVRSVDGGLHWSRPSIFSWGDRDFVVVDKTSSRYRGRIYDAATVVSRGHGKDVNYLGIMHSTDGGKTFSPWMHIFNLHELAGGKLEYNGGPLTVLPNGDVMVLGYNWPDSDTPKPMAVFVSKDGGQTFSKPLPVATRAGSLLIGSQDFREEGASVLPLIASDTSKGPFRGRVYVAWQDFNKRILGKATYPAPQAAIMLASSDDEGKTWTDPIEVDDAPAWPARQYPEVFAPTLAVNNKGIVAVTWYDARDVADGMGGALRMAVSSDGGETFSPSFAVSSAPTLITPDVEKQQLEIGIGGHAVRIITDLRYHIFGQDTQGLVADAVGVFHPLWVDNRTGVPQLWTDSIGVDQTPIRHGDPALAHLRDVTKDIDLEMSGGVYDRRTQDIATDIAVVNTSRRAIVGAVHIRMMNLGSSIGEAQVEGADNGVLGSGATFTFAPVAGTTLPPKGRSQVLHIVFHIENPHPVSPSDVISAGVTAISMNYHAYARK